MTTSPQLLHILILFSLSMISLALAQYENQFIYSGFHDSTNLRLDGLAKLHPNGLLQLTDTSKDHIGHAFYQIPLQFNTSSPMLASPLSFSTTFVFAIVPESANFGGHGIAFVISPSMDFTHAMARKYLGLFNFSSNGLSSNHLFAIELDTFQSTDFDDINDNHVGIDVNSLNSTISTAAAYFDMEGKNKNLSLVSGEPMQIWIDYDGFARRINVTLAPINIPKPTQPLLSATIDLSLVLLDSMYVGFSSSTGEVASNHYVLGWSFSKIEGAQQLDLSNLPSFPRLRRSGKRPIIRDVMISILAVSVTMIIVSGIVYVLRRKKYEELSEEWENEYRPQRFTYKDLYKATKGFNEKGLLGVGGFGKVYSGILPRSNIQVAIKKVSHDSAQGMKEFVSEIVCMGKLRHRNLVQLLGYCRRRGELLLVYDFMPNGSLDKFLLGSTEKPNLNWAQRYRILKGIASGLLYLHEEWEQVVLHRDVKASNVLLDADLNGRLGDFGLARLYDRGANPQTTRVVGTVGYIAPELTKTGKATTSTDVFAFGTFMLEVACGRRPLEVLRPLKEMVLVDWVFECSKQGAILQTSDPRLGGEYVVEEMELALKLGLLCSHSDPEARPSMRQVLQYLDGESVLSEIALENASGFGSAAIVDGASDELNMTFPSSLGNDSICYASTSSSILSRGR